jgi:hypothetical protein
VLEHLVTEHHVKAAVCIRNDGLRHSAHKRLQLGRDLGGVVAPPS